MSLFETIEKDYVQAYKAKDQVRLGTLRLLKTAAKNRQVELMRPLEDDDYMDVLLREVKQRQDSIEQYTSAGRADLAEKEAAEVTVVQTYHGRIQGPCGRQGRKRRGEGPPSAGALTYGRKDSSRS